MSQPNVSQGAAGMMSVCLRVKLGAANVAPHWALRCTKPMRGTAQLHPGESGTAHLPHTARCGCAGPQLARCHGGRAPGGVVDCAA